MVVWRTKERSYSDNHPAASQQCGLTRYLEERMAYSVLLGATPEAQIAEYQDKRRDLLDTSRRIRVSHALTTNIAIVPLRVVLGDAIDGGHILRSDLWHPMRTPRFHAAVEVPHQHQLLETAVADVVREHGPLPPGDYFGDQILELISLFAHAINSGEAIVSVVERPQDFQRARAVSIPFRSQPSGR